MKRVNFKLILAAGAAIFGIGGAFASQHKAAAPENRVAYYWYEPGSTVTISNGLEDEALYTCDNSGVTCFEGFLDHRVSETQTPNTITTRS